jgi:siroheme synthase
MKLRSKGICILAGAGPGDIGLVTLRTKEAVEQAEVIVYDYLCITPRFLNRRRRKQEISLTLIGPADRRAEVFGAHTMIDLVNDGRSQSASTQEGRTNR